MGIAAGGGYWFAQRQQRAEVPVAQGVKTGAASAPTSAEGGTEGERKILYYRNPMGLPDTSPVPKKDPMGMDYTPVYANGKTDDDGAVTVSAARVQTLGVKTAEVDFRVVDAAVRASGRIEIDERNQVVVAPRFEGWIERLHVNAVGDQVRKGQPLFTAYSPELQSTGEELRIAERLASQSVTHDPLASESARRLAEATRARLSNLEVAGQTGARQVFHAPVSGVVLDKEAIQGKRFAPGDALFRIADLSKVWIIADVYEQDLARVHVGQIAQVTLDAFPGRNFKGRVNYLYPTLDAATRSTRVRLELGNAEGLLRPGMFAQVALTVSDTTPTVVVPTSAIIDDGTRQVVLLALGEGRFKPTPVKLGQNGRNVIEVLEGVKPGDRVVVSANFLIDSESQLKAALANLVEPETRGHAHGGETTYEAEGIFDAIDAQAGSVTISHKDIPALKWPAMTMSFTISDPGLARNIAPGTPIRFVLKANKPNEYVVNSIKPIVNKAPAPVASEHRGH